MDKARRGVRIEAWFGAAPLDALDALALEYPALLPLRNAQREERHLLFVRHAEEDIAVECGTLSEISTTDKRHAEEMAALDAAHRRALFAAFGEVRRG